MPVLVKVNVCFPGIPWCKLKPGEGYIYVSRDVAEFRADCPTVTQTEIKVQQTHQRPGRTIMASGGVFAPILMCELGARKRGIDMEIAGADAKHWWKTGLVPIRPTPLAGERHRGTPASTTVGANVQQRKPWWKLW